MTRELYLKIWVQGLYESQDTFPGKPMALQDAREELEHIARYRDQYLDPPEGITPEELMRAWNRTHEWALEFDAETRKKF